MADSSGVVLLILHRQKAERTTEYDELLLVIIRQLCFVGWDYLQPLLKPDSIIALEAGKGLGAGIALSLRVGV